MFIYWCDCRGQALLLGYCVLARFWAEKAAGFFAGVVFLGFGVSLLFPSLPLLLLLLLSGGRPGCLFSSFAWLGVRTPDFRYLARPGIARVRSCLFFLLFLPGSVASPSLPPSFCLSLSLSFSLSLFASMHRDPASSHTPVL